MTTGSAEPIERRHRRGAVLGAGEGRGRDAFGLAQRLGEALRSFELRRGGAWPERRDPRLAKRVGDARDQRRLGPDHDQADVAASRQLDHRAAVARVDGDALGPARDAGIAGRREQRVAAWRLPQPPGERIFPSARTE